MSTKWPVCRLAHNNSWGVFWRPRSNTSRLMITSSKRLSYLAGTKCALITLARSTVMALLFCNAAHQWKKPTREDYTTCSRPAIYSENVGQRLTWHGPNAYLHISNSNMRVWNDHI